MASKRNKMAQIIDPPFFPGEEQAQFQNDSPIYVKRPSSANKPNKGPGRRTKNNASYRRGSNLSSNSSERNIFPSTTSTSKSLTPPSFAHMSTSPVESYNLDKNMRGSPNRKESDNVSATPTDQNTPSVRSSDSHFNNHLHDIRSFSYKNTEKTSSQTNEAQSYSNWSNPIVGQFSNMTLDGFWETGSGKLSNKTAEIYSHNSSFNPKRPFNPPVKPIHFGQEETSSIHNFNGNCYPNPFYQNSFMFPQAYCQFPTHPQMAGQSQFYLAQTTPPQVDPMIMKEKNTEKLVGYMKRELTRFPQLSEKVEKSKLNLESLFAGDSYKKQLEISKQFSALEISQLSMIAHGVREDIEEELLIEETIPRQEGKRGHLISRFPKNK